MRTLLFFDLPTLTSKNKRDYRHFVKDIIKLGFYRIQESVFVKMSINQTNADSILLSIEKIKPKEGSLFTITITEQQFARMHIFLGEFNDEVETSLERKIDL